MEILSVILGVLALSFIFAFVTTVRRMKKMAEAFAKLYVAQNMLEDYLSSKPEYIKPTKTEEEIHKENFIKFLSDSRDWAYQYIEEVQKGLEKFIKEVSPQIDYYNKYGVVVEGMIPAHDLTLKKISKEIQELKKFLPEATDDRR
jgi:Tfp pilus assembly protein PilE